MSVHVPVVTPLRQRYIEDMTAHQVDAPTQSAFVEAVAGFARHFGRSPEELSLQEVVDYQWVVLQRSCWGTLDITVRALQFLYRSTLTREWGIKPVKTLRQAMIDDMTQRNVSADLRDRYVACIENLARSFGKSPEKLSVEDLKAFQWDVLHETGLWSEMAMTVRAARFLYRVTLGRDWLIEPVLSLRERMTDDMTLRNLAKGTQELYLNAVAKFSRHLGKSPDQLCPEDIQAYQLHLVHENKVSWSTLNIAVCALRFLYCTTLRKNWVVRHVTYAKRPKKLPVVLSLEEVEQFLEPITNIKHRAMMVTAYATGCRREEVAALRVKDLDKKRMVIRIEHGKGDKTRDVMLSPYLLALLEEYCKVVRPTHWLFPGAKPGQHICGNSIGKACSRAFKASKLEKKVTPHVLRSAFATHLVEDGANVRVIQVLLGHGSLKTTQKYMHVAENTIRATRSPLDKLSDRAKGTRPSAPLAGQCSTAAATSLRSQKPRTGTTPITSTAGTTAQKGQKAKTAKPTPTVATTQPKAKKAKITGPMR